MNTKTKTLGIFSLAFLLISTLSIGTSFNSSSLAKVNNSKCEIKAEKGDEGYSEQQLKTIANRITVRVIGDNNGGSGTIIAQQGNTYLVVTNSHVIRGVNKIGLKTSDGKTYDAQIVPNIKFEKSDLALLQFQSNENYCLTEVANFVPSPEMEVMAAGYSSTKGEIVFRIGKVEKISDKPLKEGYQIGYSSDIEQGMSGGAIINSRGELIGINGRSAYPILNTGYVYPDGTRPSEEEIQQMRKLSWGIPITTLLAQVKPEIITAYSLPFPNPEPDIPQVPLTGWLGEIEQKAKQFTVRIDSSSKANGSGVIIAKEGDTYTVVTAAHVICEREDATKPCGGFNYQIITHYGKQYAVEKSSIKLEEGVDLAVVKFRSQENYQVATLAKYNQKNGEYMFTAGYPRLGEKSSWLLTMGNIYDEEQGLLQITESDFKTNNSGILQSVSQSAVSLTGGYELVYRSITFGGMSGGPVLDTQGRVIGIHGRAEGETAIDEKTGDAGSNGGRVQIGNSLGIPISTFLDLATRLNTQPQKVETNPAPKLNEQKIESIQTAILSVDVSKDNTKASQWLERGNQLWRLDRDSEAIHAFDEAIKLKPYFIHLAYYGKGLALIKNRQYLEAINTLHQAVRYKSDFVPAWSGLSLVYRRSKQKDEALIAINKAIEIEPNNPNLYNEKYVVLADSKKYKEAELAINKAIKISPRASFYYNRGTVYFEQEKWDLAENSYTQAIKINPDLPEPYNSRGNVYKKQKKWDLAEADYTQAIKINPDHFRAYKNRGNLYSDQKKWDLAEADYTQAIKINPDYAPAYIGLGTLYSYQKKWDLAENSYTQSIKIKINPDYSRLAYLLAYTGRGIVHTMQKKWDLALADYNKAIAIDPDYALAYTSRGFVYSEQKKWDLALADYNKAIAIDPDFPQTYKNRGYVYSEQKKWDLALADYNKAIAIDPDYALAYKNRGYVYYEQKKWELALADLSKAIAIDPNFAEAYIIRGILYFEQKKWDLAEADLSKGMAINPDYADSNGYAIRGEIHHQQGNYTAAISDYNQAVAKDPNSLAAISNIGLIKYEQGDKETAIKQWQQAMKINNKSAETMLALAVALYGKGEEQQAYQLAETALKLDKNFADTNFLKKNLWGEKMIADTQKLLSTPQMKTLLSQLR